MRRSSSPVMRMLSHAVFFLALLGCAVSARATRVEIESPDHETTYAWSKAVGREVRWSDKDHSLLAVVTYNNDAHADVATPGGNEDLWFRFPGTTLEADQTITVTAPTGEKIAIGRRAKSRRVDLYKNTILIVSRTGGKIRLTLNVDTERDPASVAPKNPAEQPQVAPLDETIRRD